MAGPRDWFEIGRQHSQSDFLGDIASNQAANARRQNTANSIGQMLGMAGQFALGMKQISGIQNAYGSQNQQNTGLTSQGANPFSLNQNQNNAAPGGFNLSPGSNSGIAAPGTPADFTSIYTPPSGTGFSKYGVS